MFCISLQLYSSLLYGRKRKERSTTTDSTKLHTQKHPTNFAKSAVVLDEVRWSQRNREVSKSHPSSLSNMELVQTRADDPLTLAALRVTFDDLIDQNQPEEKAYVIDKATYDSYLRALVNDADHQPHFFDKKFSNRIRFKVLYDENGPFLARAHSNKRLYYKEELFDVIYAAHKKCNHGNGKQTYLELKEAADNIFAWQCFLLTKMCFCKRAKNCRSLASPKTNSGTFEIVNMVSNPDGRYNWILLYRDDMTSFLFGRPLMSRDSMDVATELLQLFLAHGAPFRLYSSLSRGYVSKVLKKLCRLWPECPTSVGQQYCKDINTEFSRLLDQWMAKSETKQWSIGCHFVCSTINGQFSSKMGNTPYRLMHRTTLEDISRVQLDCSYTALNAEGALDVDVEMFPIIAPDEQSVTTTTQNLSHGNCAVNHSQQHESLSVGSFLFPFVESEDCSPTEIDELLNNMKTVDNAGRGDCLYHVFRQHIKAFFKREYKVEILRHRICAFLAEEDLGREFLKTYHPDIYPLLSSLPTIC